MSLLSAAVGYVVGSLPIGYLIVRHRSGVDLRTVGSGNVGATNVVRVAGASLGLVVAALDVAKGAVAVGIVRRLNLSESDAAMAGIAAVTGHVLPVWLAGRGGKGVATAGGAFALLAPASTAAAAAAFGLVLWRTRLVSAASMAASTILPIAAMVSGASFAVVTASVAATALIVWRHRENLARLRAGTERRLGHSQEGLPRA